MKKPSVLCAMALVFGVVGIANRNGDFFNWSFEDGLTGLSVARLRRHRPSNKGANKIHGDREERC